LAVARAVRGAAINADIGNSFSSNFILALVGGEC